MWIVYGLYIKCKLWNSLLVTIYCHLLFACYFVKTKVWFNPDLIHAIPFLANQGSCQYFYSPYTTKYWLLRPPHIMYFRVLTTVLIIYFPPLQALFVYYFQQRWLNPDFLHFIPLVPNQWLCQYFYSPYITPILTFGCHIVYFRVLTHHLFSSYSSTFYLLFSTKAIQPRFN